MDHLMLDVDGIVGSFFAGTRSHVKENKCAETTSRKHNQGSY